MQNPVPKLTVLMPVYNGEKYLREAIDSILRQTFTDFELLIINDGSVDSSVKIVESYQDQRIRLIHNEKNLKIVASLNRGLDLARGEYIARLDCDDVAMPTRLEKQVLFLDNNPKVAMLGSWAEEIDSAGRVVSFISFPTDALILRWRLCFCNTFIHSSIMFRKAAIAGLGGYSEEFPYAEDYDLWAKTGCNQELANFPEALVRWRNWAENCSSARGREQERQAALISKRNIKRIWPEARAGQLRVLRALYQRNPAASKEEIEELITAVDTFQEKYSRKFDLGKEIKNLKVEIITHLFAAILYSDIKAIDKIRLLFKLTAKMKPNIFRIAGIFFFKRTVAGSGLARFIKF